MSEILRGYGEDALTFWALKNEKKKILKKWGKINAIYYRPSFGRGRNIGEFDFIILTSSRLILGESKWDESGEIGKNGKVKLRAPQIGRHGIVMKIFSDAKIARDSRIKWNDLEFWKDTLASSINKRKDSILVRNMADIFSKTKRTTKIVNRLVYFHKKKKGGLKGGTSIIESCTVNGEKIDVVFKRVNIPYAAICNETPYISIEI
jgi:hypothetical protein